jgi:predicted O-methyltransferase YrrM
MMEAKLEAYIERHTSAENPLLNALNRSTHLRTLYPRMLSGHVLGRLLSMLSSMIRPQSILEIGTFTGYSALCLAEGMADDGILHTIELNEEYEDANKSIFKAAGFENKIVQHIGDAREIIPVLGMQFDMIFLDADKQSYPDYYDLLLKSMKKGSFLIADNVLWDGKVVQENKNSMDKDTIGIVLFNQRVQRDDRVENVMIPVRDGLMIIRKK